MAANFFRSQSAHPLFHRSGCDSHECQKCTHHWDTHGISSQVPEFTVEQANLAVLGTWQVRSTAQRQAAGAETLQGQMFQAAPHSLSNAAPHQVRACQTRHSTARCRTFPACETDSSAQVPREEIIVRARRGKPPRYRCVQQQNILVVALYYPLAQFKICFLELRSGTPGIPQNRRDGAGNAGPTSPPNSTGFLIHHCF